MLTANETLHNLKTKHGKIIMHNLFIEAGIPGGSKNGLNLTGLLDNICLCYLILGQCHCLQSKECNHNHPTSSISKEATEALFKQLEPGLMHLANKTK